MKILHTASMLRPPSGILKQMEWEQTAANDIGLDWDVRLFCPPESTPNNKIIKYSKKVTHRTNKRSHQAIIDWIQLRREYHSWLMEESHKYDLLLMRYYVHDPFQLAFLRKVNKPVYLVHHSLEVPELALPNNLRSYFRSNLDALLGRASIKNADGIIGVTEEIVQYEKQRSGEPSKKSYIYPNGVSFVVPEIADRRAHIPEILFICGYFVPWQGLDLLLDIMRASDHNFVLHLVGELSGSDMQRAKQDSRVVTHGLLSQTDILKISERCWIGLSSLALERKRMLQACALKVRECLMMGLPVYATYNEPFPAQFPYYKKGNLNLDCIINFAHSMRDHSKLDISTLSRKYIDKKYLLSQLASSLRADYNSETL